MTQRETAISLAAARRLTLQLQATTRRSLIMDASPAPLRSVDIGAIRITYLPDGVAHFALGVFPETSPECWARHAEQTSDGRWLCSIGSFLIESEDEKILVDLGFGETELDISDFVTAHSGRLLDSLSQIGVKPDEITTVVYTH